jgi:hypothetical protein
MTKINEGVISEDVQRVFNAVSETLAKLDIRLLEGNLGLMLIIMTVLTEVGLNEKQRWKYIKDLYDPLVGATVEEELDNEKKEK